MASSSSTPWNKQVPRQLHDADLNKADWVHELDHSSIMKQSTFRSFFSVLINRRALDLVVFFQEESNSPYGFGFIAEEDNPTGGTFRTDVYASTRLRDVLVRVIEVLCRRHIVYHSQGHDVEDLGMTKLVNYARFRIPLLLLGHQFSSYFNNILPCHFSVVALFRGRPCGFGFFQVHPRDTLRVCVEIKGMVEELKRIIADGVAVSRMLLGQGVTGSRMTHIVLQHQRDERGRGSGSVLGQGIIGNRMTQSVQQQQHRGERGRGSAASEEIYNTALNTFSFRPAAEVFTHYSAFNTPSGAHLWSSSQTAPSYVFGSAEVTGQSISRNFASHSYAVMDQRPQSFLHSQPTAWMISPAATNRPISAPLSSGTSAGVMGHVLGGRFADPSVSSYSGGYSNTMMQQQPEPSIHFQTTSSFGATGQILSGSLDGGQPTTSEWSRVVGSNSRAHNRDARGNPPPNPSAGNSAIYPNEWDMWK